MSSITFLNPGFWPWLLALGLPIFIHLLTRRTRRERILPTFQFLQRSLAQQSQVFRLRRWLLLALRLALLLFLVLAFLKPTLTAPLTVAEGQKRTLVVVLDVSLSMGYTQGGVSSMAHARGQAATLLDGLRQGDLANVILAGTTPHGVLPKPGGDFGTLQQALKSANATPERADIPAALALAAQQLAQSDATQKELVLASDFQRSNWGDAQFDALPPDVKLVFLNSDPDERANTAVTSLKLQPTAPRAGEEASAVVEIWNGSHTARTLPVTLEWQAEDRPYEPGTVTDTNVLVTEMTRTVTLPPYASGTAIFPLTFPEAGRYLLTAQVPADSLPTDDHRYFVADLEHSLTVLLLTDAELHGDTGAYFLLRALNPTPNIPGGVRVLPRHAADLTATDLKTCDAVIFHDVRTLPADKLPLLARYVSEGGSLIAFLAGPQTIGQMAALAKQAKPGDGLPFLPRVPMDVRRQGKGYVTLTEARYDSPLLKLFKDPGSADLGKIHFTHFFLTGEPDPRAEVLLKFEDSTPAAARRNFGAGSILLCNFSPAPGDSDLARQEVFPPLVHEFLKGMTDRTGARREFLPGGAASATLDAALMRGDIAARDPNDTPEPVSVDRTSGSVILEHVEMPGFHTVTANGQPAVTLAVNPSSDESDLRALDPRELESKRSARPSYLVGGKGEGAAVQLERLQRGRPLWPYCLLLALFALLLEQAVTTVGGQARIRSDSHANKNVATRKVL